MKIVHIANFYGPNSGGIKTTIHELGRGYQRYGNEFIYIVPGPKFMQESTIFGTEICLPGRTLPGSGGYQVIASKRQLRNLLEFLQPDIVEVSDRFTLIWIGKWAKRQKIKSVVFSHETLLGLIQRFIPLIPKSMAKLISNWHNRKLSKSFNYVIATTEFAAREFKAINCENLRIIKLGVDLETFNPTNRSDMIHQELGKGSEFVLMHSARMSPEKEPQRAIEALRELINRGYSIRLVMLGCGPMWKKIKKISRGLPVDTLGYICDRTKLAKYLASADIMIAPGPLETFCLSALESLASGTPVVASKSSAVGELLEINSQHPVGSVAADNGISFAAEIEKILNFPNIRIRSREVAEQFNWSTTVDCLLTLYGAKKPMVTTRKRLRVA